MQVAFRIAPFERRNTSLVSTQLLLTMPVDIIVDC